MNRIALAFTALTCTAGLAAAVQAAPASSTGGYKLVASVPLGAPDRWDYVVSDPQTGRVYVAHGDHVAVLDGRAGTLIGDVAGISGGTHGFGLANANGKLFADDGKNGLAVAIDPKSLKITGQIKVEEDADGIARDAATGRIFVIEGDTKKIGVIDPKTNKVLAQIDTGEGLEYGAGDGRGFVYVAGVEKRTVLKINARTLKIAARWSAPTCERPHGLAVDGVGHRVFMSCTNSQMVVLDGINGKIVATLPIGRGSDAAAWDPKRKRAFSSNGADGTISVYRQISPNRYEALETVKTAVSGRTMDVDPVTGRLYVAAAEVSAPAQPGGRPRPVPGSMKLMIFAPIP